MKYRLSVLFVLLLCSGCDVRYESPTTEAKFICSSTQLEMVKKQSDICSDNGYLGSYCWNLARSEQCTAIAKAQGVQA